MIRVAFVNRHGAETGGAEESLALLIRHLPADFEAHAILFGDGNYAERLRADGVRVHIIRVPERFLSATRERPNPLGALDLPGAIATVRSLLRREGIEVVHTNTVKAHLVAVPAAISAGVGSVVHLRDMVPGFGKQFVGLAAARARRRIAISKAVDKWYGVRDTRVIFNPIDLSQYDKPADRRAARARLGISGVEPLVSIVGRINRWKGHDRFLRIAHQLLQRREARFAIVGEPRFRDVDFVPELHALAKGLGIAEYLHFVPWQADLRDAYSATDVLCNCSEREPFGRTMIEAAALGKPSIAFDDGGAPDIIIDDVTGFLAPAGNEARFTDALERALDPATLARLGSAARSHALSFGASRHAQLVASLLREAAAR